MYQVGPHAVSKADLFQTRVPFLLGSEIRGMAGAVNHEPAADILTFNDSTSFEHLIDCHEDTLPMALIALHTFKKPPPDALLETFKTKFAKEHILNKEFMDYDMETNTLYTVNEPFNVPVCMLPAGSIIHRYDKEGARDPSKNVPIFFGNKQSVKHYSGKSKPEEINATRSSYRLVRPARLFHATMNSLRALKQAQLDDEEVEFFENYQLEGAIVPAVPYGTLREMAAGTRPKAFNRRFAELICRLGFDGYVVKPFNVEKRQGLIQLTGGIPQIRLPNGDVITLPTYKAMSAAEKEARNVAEGRFIAPLSDTFSHMPPEIVLCKWDAFTERVHGGGAGYPFRRKRQTRRRRQ